MIKAVILDFDDTLTLTEEACYRLGNDVLKQMGRPKMDRKVHMETWGQQIFEVMGVRSPGIDLEEFKKIYSKVLDEYINSGNFDQIPETNFETLRQIEKQGKHLAILTGRSKAELRHILVEEHLLNGLIKEFYHQDNLCYQKPDPRTFDDIINKNNLKPAECVYVGDSLNDAKAALGAKMNFIATLESGLRKKEDFTKLGVDYFIYKFPDLLKAIKCLDKY